MFITAEERNVLLKSRQGERNAVKMENALAKAVKDSGVMRWKQEL